MMPAVTVISTVADCPIESVVPLSVAVIVRLVALWLKTTPVTTAGFHAAGVPLQPGEAAIVAVGVPIVVPTGKVIVILSQSASVVTAAVAAPAAIVHVPVVAAAVAATITVSPIAAVVQFCGLLAGVIANGTAAPPTVAPPVGVTRTLPAATVIVPLLAPAPSVIVNASPVSGRL